MVMKLILGNLFLILCILVIGCSEDPAPVEPEKTTGTLKIAILNPAVLQPTKTGRMIVVPMGNLTSIGVLINPNSSKRRFAVPVDWEKSIAAIKPNARPDTM